MSWLRGWTRWTRTPRIASVHSYGLRNGQRMCIADRRDNALRRKRDVALLCIGYRDALALESLASRYAFVL